MNKTAVIYQSKYGFTKAYAQWLAEELGADLLIASKVKPVDLDFYQTIIYGGGLYAGGVNGIALLTKNAERIIDKSLYLFTVGISDVTDNENISAIRANLDKALPVTLKNKIHIYHLRGGLRYSKMSFLHRIMMKMMAKMIRSKSESELRAEDKIMINSFGQDVDFTDAASLRSMIEEIKKTEKSQ